MSEWIDRTYSTPNFRARFKVLLSLPWFGGIRVGILRDRQDGAYLLARWGRR